MASIASLIMSTSAIFIALIPGTLSFTRPSCCTAASNRIGPGFPCPKYSATDQLGGGWQLRMVPRYDPSTQRWEPTTPDEESGYSPLGTLLRQGPVPFVQRLVNADQYEQGVLKMMSEAGMDRDEAQGNMDAYLQNPNDWALQKLEDEKGGTKFDYANANLDPEDLILTGIWSSILLAIITRVVYVSATGCDAMCRTYHF